MCVVHFVNAITALFRQELHFNISLCSRKMKFQKILFWLNLKLFKLQVALNRIHLRYAMSFLPVARSSATLDYFYALQADGTDLLGDDRTEIVAMDLGLKETLFHEYLMEDAVYLLIALIFISLTILIYTQSMFITIATLLAITYALSLAYFIYTFVCGIKFFPFMNVLAAVIAIGKS